MTTLTPEIAEQFGGLALAHVSREFPYKMDHVFTGPQDVIAPRAAHPIFFGSFDWHSCVHGYWLMARLVRRHPEIEAASAVKARINAASATAGETGRKAPANFTAPLAMEAAATPTATVSASPVSRPMRGERKPFSTNSAAPAAWGQRLARSA